MAVHTYEILFLFDPNKASADWDGVTGQATGVIERHGGEIAFARHWGEPKLAYPIRKFRKGSYFLVYFRSDPKNILAMEADFRLMEPLLRHLIVKLEPQIAEGILAHLQGEGQAEPEPAPALAEKTEGRREPAGRR